MTDAELIEHGAQLMFGDTRNGECPDDLVRGRPWLEQVRLLGAMVDRARELGRFKVPKLSAYRKFDARTARRFREGALNGVPVAQLAERHGVSLSTAYRLLRGDTYRAA